MAFLGKSKDPYKMLQDALRSGDHDKAISCLEAILNREPDNQQTRLRYADTLALAGKKQKAVREYMDLATHMAHDGFLIKAIAVYKKLVKLDPSREDFHQELAEMNRAREEGRDYLNPEERATAAQKAREEAARAPAEEKPPAEEAASVPVSPAEEVEAEGPAEPAGEEAPAVEPAPEQPVEAEEAAEHHAVEMDAGEPEVAEAEPATEEEAPGLQFDLETGGVREAEQEPAPEPVAEEAVGEPAAEEPAAEEPPEEPVTAEPAEPEPVEAPAAEDEGDIEDEVGAAFDSLERGEAPEGAEAREAAATPAAGLVLETEKIPLFSDFSTEEFTEVVLALRHFYYPAGHVVVQEGDPGDSMFILVMGEVKVTTTDPFDNVVDLATLGEGEFFGEVALLSGKPRTATITTTQESEVMELAREDFDRIAEKRPGVRETVERFWKERSEKTVEAMVASMERMEEGD